MCRAAYSEWYYSGLQTAVTDMSIRVESVLMYIFSTVRFASWHASIVVIGVDV